jgi:hypothetical protein
VIIIMHRPTIHLRGLVSRLWQSDAPLTATGVLMLGLLAFALVGLLIDPRVIGGAPAWLKPAKFAASIAIYTLTLAWIFTFLREWPRTRRVISWMTALVMIGEMALISLQAARGTTSHFNVGQPFDAAVYSAMGSMIAVMTLSSIAVAVALWRQRFEDRALGWALRLGMTIALIGASTGGLMTTPTRAQLEAARAGQRMTIAGAHTVGGPDGGPGLPGTGWSTQHGDVRIAHFVGLHALQALPVLALLLRRRRIHDETRARLVLIAAASYATLFALLLWQALRGQSILQPDATMITAVAAWAAISAAAAWLASTRPRAARPHAMAI